MSLNIGGVCFDKAIGKRVDVLNDIFEVHLDFVDTVSMEEAMNDWPNDDYFFVISNEKSTWVLCDFEYCTIPYLIEGVNVLSFVYLEDSQTFAVCYSESSILRNHVTEQDGQIIEQKSDSNAIDESSVSTKEKIEFLFEKMMGVKLLQLPNEFEVSRFKLSTEPVFEELTEQGTAVFTKDLEQIEIFEKPREESFESESFDKSDITQQFSKEQLTKHFSSEERLKLLHELIALCQRNKWNIFLSPLGFKDIQFNVLRNIDGLRELILKDENKHQELKKLIDIEDFRWLASYSNAAIDDKTWKLTFWKTMSIKTPHYNVPKSDMPSEPKWWRFW